MGGRQGLDGCWLDGCTINTSLPKKVQLSDDQILSKLQVVCRVVLNQ